MSVYPSILLIWPRMAHNTYTRPLRRLYDLCVNVYSNVNIIIVLLSVPSIVMLPHKRSVFMATFLSLHDLKAIYLRSLKTKRYTLCSCAINRHRLLLLWLVQVRHNTSSATCKNIVIYLYEYGQEDG